MQAVQRLEKHLPHTDIMWLLRPLLRADGACGLTCGECGRLIWGRMPEKEHPHALAYRTIKRARFGVTHTSKVTGSAPPPDNRGKDYEH